MKEPGEEQGDGFPPGGTEGVLEGRKQVPEFHCQNGSVLVPG